MDESEKRGVRRVKFIPVKDGDLIVDPRRIVTSGYDRGKDYSTDTNTLIGFKPGRSGRAEGHLVFLIREDRPKSSRVRKLRPAKESP